jgi:hypothetical protein
MRNIGHNHIKDRRQPDEQVNITGELVTGQIIYEWNLTLDHDFHRDTRQVTCKT